MEETTAGRRILFAGAADGGFETVAAESAAHALALLFCQSVDALLVDTPPPDMGGAAARAHEMMNGRRPARSARGALAGKEGAATGGATVAMLRRIHRLSLGALLALGATAALLSVVSAAGTDGDLLKQAQSFFRPLPKDMATAEFPVTPARVDLGRVLFFDPRISVDGTVSCARCHQPALYGTDGLAKPRGAHDRINPRNAPTVLNAALQFKEHWRGDRANVEDQAMQALIGPPSFGDPDYASAMAKIKAIPGYDAMFRKAFPGEQDPVTPDDWGKAIGAYERTLVTPSRFDRYLAGDAGALSPAERAGLRTFIDTGCVACHNGVGVGGGSFQKFGVVEDYWKETGSKHVDKGRFDVTHDPKDMDVFKVPSLRNVAMTPPYFHDGSVRTLPEAVRIMARVQLGKSLSDQDTNAIVAFLESLTGALPKDFATAPVLPPSAFAAPAEASADQRK